MEQEEKIQEIVKKYDLKNKSREHDYVYRRHYFCSYLRSMGYTYQQIAKILNKHHASAMHSVRKYNELKEDTYFQTIVYDIEYDLIDADIMPLFTDKRSRSENVFLKLINRLFECRDMQDVESLKGFVNENINPNMLR